MFAAYGAAGFCLRRRRVKNNKDALREGVDAFPLALFGAFHHGRHGRIEAGRRRARFHCASGAGRQRVQIFAR